MKNSSKLIEVRDSLKFRKINEKYLYETISYLIDENIFFEIAIKISFAEFNPELPKKIQDSFKETTMFAFANYTFESIKLSEDKIIFETGFGTENIGSIVTVPLKAIQNIIVDNINAITINITATSPNLSKENSKNSIKSIFSNPKNSNFFKKK